MYFFEPTLGMSLFAIGCLVVYGIICLINK